jgi:putative Holliday junction resolvase
MNSSERAEKPFAKQGRLAGVDYGTKRIGVAISDPGQTLSSPLENYQRGDSSQDAKFFQRLVVEEQIVGWVIGLPLHLSGDESEKSAEARAFATWLADLTDLPYRFADERFSSVEAERYLAAGGLTSKKRKQRRDMLAAQILLAAYLESHHQDEEHFGDVAE